MLKRSGRGHYIAGVRNIEPGGLCLRCPACPAPDNVPSNWRTVADDLK